MQTTIHQHFVPRMYLKQWVHHSEKNDMLYVISPKLGNSTIFEKSYDDELFYEDYCYDVTSLDGEVLTENEIEKELGKYESRHQRLLSRVLDRCKKREKVIDKGTNRLSDFMEFVGLMAVRNPKNPLPMQTIFDDRVISSVEFANALNAVFGECFEFTGTKVAAVAARRKMLFRMADEFKKIEPTVYFFEAPKGVSFITSDNPVLVFHEYIYLPLSPKYAVYILLDESKKLCVSPGTVNIITEEAVLQLNRLYLRHDVSTLVGADEDILKQTLPIEMVTENDETGTVN